MNSVLQPVKVVFSEGCVRLRELYACVRNVRPASSHGPNELADATFIFDLHLSGKLLSIFRIGGAHRSIEFLDPRGIGREGSWPVLGQRDFVKPCVKVFLTKLVDIGFGS
jgi:hypothetical protein